jgi:rhamnogalacturonan endolyase
MSVKFFLATTCALAAGACLANVPGGGDGAGPAVQMHEQGESIVLDNGIVSISIGRRDASIGRFTYRAINLFGGGHGGGKFYWSWNAPAYGGPRGSASVSVDPQANGGDYAEVKIHSPWSGKAADAAMDVDVYYSLKRGAHGFYAAAVLDHPAAYPRVDVGEWRSNAYVSPIFDWLSVDALRQREMPDTQDMNAALPVAGAPKEVTLLTSGIHAGSFECKYAYSADLGDLDVWGWSSTKERVGIWMTVPSHEYYNGGPMKRELTAHMDRTLLNMLNGTHYGMGNGLSMAAGVALKKTYGPYLVYANSYAGAPGDDRAEVVRALWQDARAQAAAEQSAWPYAWFRNADYVQESGRGRVGGTLAVDDAGNPSASAAGAWIGLAPDDDGTDFQLQGRTDQFWVKAGADGRFIIPHVLPGAYHLWAFGAGNIGAFERRDVRVEAGDTLDLGALRWTPPRAAPTLWEIGVPDRDSREFADGAFNYTQWATYARSLAGSTAGLTYTVGQSDWRRDWRYAQFGTAPWTIRFSLANAPPADAPASLYLALASSESTLAVSVNGVAIGTYQAPHPSHAPVRLGSHGAFAEVRFAVPAGLLRQGQNAIAITQQAVKGRAGTTQYDYLRLEAAGTRLSPSPGAPRPTAKSAAAR